jgi:predicted TIM-barrel fold metal-dependent hydrolase
MIVDTHVHVCAFTDRHGWTSARLLKTLPFRFMRWRLGMTGADERTERQVEQTLAGAIDDTPELDAAVVLAFDAVHAPDGKLDPGRTHLYVKNDYVIELCRRQPKMLFAASVHPYRSDAIAEIDRCVAAGAVLMKWLPIVQGFNPADDRCLPFYEALARHKLPLLSHTGGEKTLIRVNDAFADPALLEPALKLGVTVIAAHCGSRSTFFETDYVDTFVRLVHQYPNLYGDTAALNLPTRNHAYRKILADPLVPSRLVHGSDWPVPPIPPLSIGLPEAWQLMGDPNWLRRDLRIKQRLGFDRDYWDRAGTILRLPRSAEDLHVPD